MLVAYPERWKSCHSIFLSVTNKNSSNTEPKAGAFCFLLSSLTWISIFMIENRNSSFKHFLGFAKKDIIPTVPFQEWKLSFHSTLVPEVFTSPRYVICQCDFRKKGQVWPDMGDKRVVKPTISGMVLEECLEIKPLTRRMFLCPSCADMMGLSQVKD